MNRRLVLLTSSPYSGRLAATRETSITELSLQVQKLKGERDQAKFDQRNKVLKNRSRRWLRRGTPCMVEQREIPYDASWLSNITEADRLVRETTIERLRNKRSLHFIILDPVVRRQQRAKGNYSEESEEEEEEEYVPTGEEQAAMIRSRAPAAYGGVGQGGSGSQQQPLNLSVTNPTDAVSATDGPPASVVSVSSPQISQLVNDTTIRISTASMDGNMGSVDESVNDVDNLLNVSVETAMDVSNDLISEVISDAIAEAVSDLNAEISTDDITQSSVVEPTSSTPTRTLSPPGTPQQTLHEITEHVSPCVKASFEWGLRVGDVLDISDTESIVTCTRSRPESPEIGGASSPANVPPPPMVDLTSDDDADVVPDDSPIVARKIPRMSKKPVTTSE